MEEDQDYNVIHVNPWMKVGDIVYVIEEDSKYLFGQTEQPHTFPGRQPIEHGWIGSYTGPDGRTSSYTCHGRARITSVRYEDDLKYATVEYLDEEDEVRGL